MEKMPIKKFCEDVLKQNGPLPALNLAVKLMELESIENWLRLMYGVELEVNVVPAEVLEGRWYGKGIAEQLNK